MKTRHTIIDGRAFHPVLQAAQIELMQAIKSKQIRRVVIPQGELHPVHGYDAHKVAAQIISTIKIKTDAK